MSDHPEFEDLLPLVSVPAEEHDRHALSRRRFLQGVLATAGAAAVLPGWRSSANEAWAAPGGGVGALLGPNDGLLVNVFIGGGNDGLNTVVPKRGATRARYDQLRPGVAVPAAGVLPLPGSEWGLHPRLVGLHRRFGAGRVAVVQGAGLAGSDLSHLTAMQHMMAGTPQPNGTGWLGRWLDELPDGDSGMRAVALSSSVPMYLLGRKAKVTALPSDGELWGATRTGPGEGALIDAVASFADGPTGLGQWGDAIAANAREAITQAGQLTAVLTKPSAGASDMERDLHLAAQVLNAGLGVRTVGVTVSGGWDTHIAQLGKHEQLLAQLDVAIERFFATLAPELRSRTVMLVQSEFGRRPEGNASLGTDHGTASPMFVIGENVRGGLHAAPPSLTTLDERGNLIPTADWRDVYAQLVGPWLGGDPQTVLKRSAGGLNLFAASPGHRR